MNYFVENLMGLIGCCIFVVGIVVILRATKVVDKGLEEDQIFIEFLIRILVGASLIILGTYVATTLAAYWATIFYDPN